MDSLDIVMKEALDELEDIIRRIDILASYIIQEADDEGYHIIYDWASEIKSLISGNNDDQ